MRVSGVAQVPPELEGNSLVKRLQENAFSKKMRGNEDSTHVGAIGLALAPLAW